MEIQILYTIDFALTSTLPIGMLKRHCYEHNIEMEYTGFKGIYRFTGSYEDNIWKLKELFNLKVFIDPSKI